MADIVVTGAGVVGLATRPASGRRSSAPTDRGRLDATDAVGGGRDPRRGPDFEIIHSLKAAAPRDPECLRAVRSVLGVVETPARALADEGRHDRVRTLGAGRRDAPVPGPDRAGLLEIVAG